MSTFVKTIPRQVEDANLIALKALINCVGLAIIQHLVDDAYISSEVASAILITYLLKRLVV